MMLPKNIEDVIGWPVVINMTLYEGGEEPQIRKIDGTITDYDTETGIATIKTLNYTFQTPLAFLSW